MSGEEVTLVAGATAGSYFTTWTASPSNATYVAGYYATSPTTKIRMNGTGNVTMTASWGTVTAKKVLLNNTTTTPSDNTTQITISPSFITYGFDEVTGRPAVTAVSAYDSVANAMGALALNGHYTVVNGTRKDAGWDSVTVRGVGSLKNNSGTEIGFVNGEKKKGYEIRKMTLISKEDVGKFFDTSDISSKLRFANNGTTDSVIASGSAVYSSKPALRSGYSGAGTVTLYYDGTNYPKSSTAPKDTGWYNVGFTITGGTNIDSVPVANPVPLGRFQIRNGSLQSAAVIWRDTTVVYSAGLVYTINGPSIVSNSAQFGSRDTIIVNSVAWKSGIGTGTPKVEKVGTKGANIQINAEGVGTLVITAKVRSTTTGTVQKLESALQTLEVKIGEKALVAKDVKEITTLSSSIIYTAANQDVSGNFIVYDGSIPLTNGKDYTIITSAAGVSNKSKHCDDGKCNMSEAGKAYFVIYGKTGSTYSDKDTVSVSYTIKPATLNVIATATAKTYDGTADIDTAQAGTVGSKGRMAISFVGLLGGQALENVKDFLIKDAKFDSKDVVTSAKATATVSLVSDSKKAANYVLASGSVTDIVSDAIKIRTPSGVDGNGTGDTSTFVYTIPKEVYFNALRRSIGNVTLKKDMTNTGSTLTVLYSYAANDTTIKAAGGTTPFTGDTTIAPMFVGKYDVKVRIAGTGKNITAGTYKIGELEIQEAPKPIIGNFEESNISIRQGRSTTITVNATSPNGGTLSYKWVEKNQATGVVKSVGSNSKDLLVNATTQGVFEYKVAVTNTKSGVQVAATDSSGTVTVTVLPPPVSLAKSIVTLSSEPVVYNGGSNNGPATIEVTYFTVEESGDTTFVPLVADVDYSVSYSNAKDVGTATLRITGINDYSGSITKTYNIVKADLDPFDFVFTASNVYTGKALSADVKLIASKSGVGELTVTYDGKSDVPTDRGNYDIVVSAAAGTNFNAATNIYVGDYEITQPDLDEKSFTYTIPTGHKEGVDGTVYGIGKVEFKNKDWKDYGDLTVLYNGFEASEIETWVANTYTVSVEISGGKNFDANEVVLGTYRILGEGDAVKSGNRDIPKSNATQVVTVAPVKVAAANFTAGPSPVSKNGTIKFFSTKVVKSGSLYIFDNSGNAVAKVSAKSGTGEIASWNLKDKGGVSVAEGTYVVKGALAGKDGTREKVSFVFSVVK